MSGLVGTQIVGFLMHRLIFVRVMVNRPLDVVDRAIAPGLYFYVIVILIR